MPRISVPSGPRETVSEGAVGAFRKPQSLSIRRGASSGSSAESAESGVSGKTSRTGPVPVGRRDTDAIPPIRRQASGPVDRVVPPQAGASSPGQPEAPEQNPVVASEESGLDWMVKSPTGLVLEFSSPALLVTWSAVVDNPAPYQVCRTGGDWMPLETFLQEFKKGPRLTQAFRPSQMTGRSPSGSMDVVSRGPEREATATATPEVAPPPVPRTPTTGFTFKVANTSKPSSPGWVKPLIWALFLGAAGVGGYFLWLFTK